jgi:carnitine-CoA ligase
VIAHPAANGEDDIRLVVVRKAGADVAPGELFAWLRERLPKFMLPRYIEFVDALPRTGTDKVEKRVLAQHGPGADAWDAEVLTSTNGSGA